MDNQKIYCGSGKEKKFDNGGSLISVTLDLDTLIEQFNNHGFVSNQGSKKIKITVGTRRTVGEYGDTHSVTLDTWHPATYIPPAAGKPIFEPEDIVDDEDPVF